MNALVGRLAVVLVLIGGAVLPAAGAPPARLHAQRVPGDGTIDESETAMSQTEQEVLAAVNDYRRQRNLAPLETSPVLTRAAVWKATALARGAPWAHEDPDRTFEERLLDCGYDFTASGNRVGEVVGGVDGPPPRDEVGQVLAQWRSSPVHDEQLLAEAFQFIGIARARVGNTTAWVADFGKLPDARAARTQAPAGGAGGSEGEAATPRAEQPGGESVP